MSDEIGRLVDTQAPLDNGSLRRMLTARDVSSGFSAIEIAIELEARWVWRPLEV
jgi:hypothetical protein